MKVKQLSFSSWVSGYYESANKAYDIQIMSEGYQVLFSARFLRDFVSLKKAKEFCQDHFEKFVLSQIF